MAIEYKPEDIINCWNCNTEMSIALRSENDGDCPCCDVEIDLNEELYNAPPQK